MKNILVLSVSAGAGHVRAAEAICAWAPRAVPPIQAMHLDVMHFAPATFRKLYTDYYITLVTKHPEWWRAIYRVTANANPVAAAQKFRRMIERLNTRDLLVAIEAAKPDAIVCTHFLPAELLMHAIRRGRVTVPVHVQITDYDLHRMWVMPHMAGYFAPNAEIAARLPLFGIDPARVTVTGIPIMPDFAPDGDQTPAQTRAAAATRFGLDPAPARRTLLLMGGGAGMGALARVAAGMLDLGRDIQLIVLAGRNQETLAELRRMAQTAPGLFPFGFTSEVPALLRCADLVITKPGGLSTSECLALGRPMILSEPIPGQEEHNADYLLENGAALKAVDLPALLFRVAALLDDPARLARMQAASAALGRPYAGRDLLASLARSL